MVAAAELQANAELDEAMRLDAEVDRLLDETSERANRVYDVLLKIRECDAWKTLGWKSWAHYAESKVGKARRDVYRHLEAALVVKELRACHPPADEESVVTNLSQPPEEIPASQLRALTKAPEGTRAEVLSVAAEASGGKPTAETVKAAVEAKKADPEAPTEQLVEAVRAAVAAKADPTPEPDEAEEEAVAPVENEPASDEAESPEEVVQSAREDHAEMAAKRDELSDDEWLSSLPLLAKLQGHALDKFRRDSLYYRRFEPIRRQLSAFHSTAKKAVFRGASSQGFVSFRVGQLLSVEHPKNWFVCPPDHSGGCDGTGTVGMIGQCPMCHGRGYLAR